MVTREKNGKNIHMIAMSNIVYLQRRNCAETFVRSRNSGLTVTNLKNIYLHKRENLWFIDVYKQ